MALKLIFLRRNSSFFGKLICWWTKGPYQHVALLFPGNLVVEAMQGVGVQKYQILSYNPALWDEVDVSMTIEEVEKILTWVLAEMPAKYDWFGLIMAQIFGIARESKTKWFCSELATAALQQVGGCPGVKPCRVSPNKLFRMLSERNAVLKQP